MTDAASRPPAAFPGLDFWQEKYRSGHTPWDLGRVSDPVLALLAEHFPAEGRVLVPGCGRGHEAVYLAACGYRVTALDIAEEPLVELRAAAQARGLEPGRDLEIARADVLALPADYAGAFDVVLEQTCLCALNPARFGDYARMAHTVLKPGGRLLGVFMEVAGGGGPPYSTPPALVKALFHSSRGWAFEGLDPMPRNPARPGPEFIARFRKM
ncbi:MAG: methyltransferase domain-containing protein [Candidatus Lambdaproteobacteria bacterium]|nr:methyltransferase domain-containing protein [Candidatus Lambdaproteobacteria bacterium]